jgi:hypothetical protein
MKTILLILLLIIFPQKQKLEYNNGVPTVLGIDTYVNSSKNQRNFIKEYQKLAKDSLYNDIFFVTKAPPKTQKNPPLAYNTLSLNYDCEITVNNQARYAAFEYDTLHKDDYNQDQYFLKATIFHEITHYYFMQCVIELEKINHVEVNKYYTYGVNMIPNQEYQYGASFIEEGVCEYVIQKWKLCPELLNYRVPRFKEDFEDKKLDYDIKYMYASNYLKKFLDMQGTLKVGIQTLLLNNPPNYKEIMNPNLYFNRLK